MVQGPALPVALARRAFTVADGRDAGLSAWELREGGLRRPTRGVRAPTPPSDDTAARCQDLVPVLPAGAVFSHATAVDLLGIDRPAGLRRPDLVHVAVEDPADRPRRAGLVAHARRRVQRGVLLRHGLPVMPPAEVWVQLAGELSAVELVVLGDAMLRRRGACAAPGDLARAVEALPPGTRGLRTLRTALPRLRPGTDSCPETRLRLLLVDAGLPCPEVNVPVTDAAGRFVALPDLTYRDARLAVEYDGDVHRTDRRTWRRDVARKQALEDLGWRTITCTGDDLRAPEAVLARIRRALHRA